jgi:cell division septation protein DedD
VSDEGFREIQLNGKQLIFLFMAVTVVSVVIFLFGVLVGRGARPGTETAEMVSGDVAPDSGQAAAPQGSAPPAPASNSGMQPPAGQSQDLSYPDRLLSERPAEENLKAPAAAAAGDSSAPSVREPVAEKAPAPPPAAPADPAPAPVVTAPRRAEPRSIPAPAAAVQASDPSGPGFSVQVAAYRDRGEADSLAKRLTDKGYPAFVMAPVKGAATAYFRVRVGKYKSRKDAEAVEARLQTAEKLSNAWIAR